jgi:hypothetical protein
LKLCETDRSGFGYKQGADARSCCVGISTQQGPLRLHCGFTEENADVLPHPRTWQHDFACSM